MVTGEPVTVNALGIVRPTLDTVPPPPATVMNSTSPVAALLNPRTCPTVAVPASTAGVTNLADVGDKVNDVSTPDADALIAAFVVSTITCVCVAPVTFCMPTDALSMPKDASEFTLMSTFEVELTVKFEVLSIVSPNVAQSIVLSVVNTGSVVITSCNPCALGIVGLFNISATPPTAFQSELTCAAGMVGLFLMKSSAALFACVQSL